MFYGDKSDGVLSPLGMKFCEDLCKILTFIFNIDFHKWP